LFVFRRERRQRERGKEQEVKRQSQRRGRNQIITGGEEAGEGE
jgi:hypothetical protein